MGTRRDFSPFFHHLKYMLSWWWFFGKCRSGSSNYECEYMYIYLSGREPEEFLNGILLFFSSQMVLLHSTMSNAVNDYSLCWVNGVKFECNEIQQAQLWRRATFDRRREFLIIIIVCTEWTKESLWVWAALKWYQLGSELEAIMLNMWETSLVHRSRCSVFGGGDVELCINFIKFHSKKTCNRPKISRVMEMGKSTWLQSLQIN